MADKELNEELNESVETAEVKAEEKTADKKGDAKKKTEKKKGPGFGQKILNVLKDFRGEIKKITWPTPKQTLRNTLVVLGMMIVVGIFVFLLDTAFSSVVELLAGIGK